MAPSSFYSLEVLWCRLLSAWSPAGRWSGQSLSEAGGSLRSEHLLSCSLLNFQRALCVGQEGDDAILGSTRGRAGLGVGDESS